MTALADDRSLDQVAFGVASMVQGGVDGATKLYMGAFAAPLTATGYLAVGGGVASTNAVMGIASARADNTDGSDGDISANLANGIFKRGNSATAALTQAHFGKPCYAEDDQTVRNVGGATYPLAGVFLGLDQEGECVIFVSAVMNYLLSQGALETDLASAANAKGASKIGLEDAAGNVAAVDVEAAIAEIFTLLASVANGKGAALLGIEDASAYWAGATGETVLDEIGADMTSAQETWPLPVTGLLDKDGDPLAKFVDGDTEVPGYNLADAEAFGIRWNNKATHDPFLCSIPMPQDLDDSQDVIVHFLASKTGNTLADATTFTLTGFFHTVGALHDADADVGGASSAMTGDAAAKTIQEETLTIAAADVPASPSTLSLTVQPTDGTLATDDVLLEGYWLEYTRKKMTS